MIAAVYVVGSISLAAGKLGFIPPLSEGRLGGVIKN
jgi:hypothetical protein